MNISFVEIRNFRRLKSCRIDIGPKSTVLVGANNSGKTSAMFAFLKFLKRRQLTLDDFTISNQSAIIRIGKKYIDEAGSITPSIYDWADICPFMDIWLDVRENELRYVANIIPSLSWRSGRIGIRLIYEPDDVEKLFNAFVDAYSLARERSGRNALWPTNLVDFLQHKLRVFFTMHAFILDESQITPPTVDNIASPQNTPYVSAPLEFDPFRGLIKIDIISAQRWLEDSEGIESNAQSEAQLLSDQLREYYDKQLDPERKPSQADIKALDEFKTAKDVFDKQIAKRFRNAMDELAKFGYPGRYNPKIVIESKTSARDILNHNTVVKYPVFSDGEEVYKLPERMNGLGYQNLISMSFKLMNFRDSWVNSNRRKADDEEIEVIQPIHLVLIEEPEAHLHVQVQQVFIRNAYEILRNNPLLKTKSNYTTQMIVSTHSSSIAEECNFSDLRYFKRIKDDNGLPVSVVANLSCVFGPQNATTRFVTRYLRTTHCDLFFADAAIFIEGAGERILLPYFISKYKPLGDAYISTLEVGGRYAHYFKPLIDILGISCLVITDLDCSKNQRRKPSVRPERGKGYISSNPTIKNWVILNDNLDYLLDLPIDAKVVTDPTPCCAATRIAYQTPVELHLPNGMSHEFIPTTFEDALAYANSKLFRNIKGTGLIKKFKDAFSEEDAETISKKVYDAVADKNAKKADFALDLIFAKDPSNLIIPQYISEGLEWLKTVLLSSNTGDFLSEET